jgi:hypothetical protein
MSDVALALIRTGNSKPEHVTSSGNTALLMACYNEMADVALELIQTGNSKPEQVSENGNTALIYACDTEMSAVALALIRTENSNPTQINDDGETALDFAQDNDMQEVVDLLLLIPEVVEAQAQRAPQAPQGVAFEIHNFFNLLNIDNIKHFLTEFNDSNPEFNVNIILKFLGKRKSEPTVRLDNIISFDPLFSPLINFVKNTYPENEKQEKIDGLKSINTSIESYGNYNQILPLLKLVITFVSKQSDEFITQYIDILKYDCLNAYNSGVDRSSCTKGMVERTVTALKEVSIVLLSEDTNNEFYIQLKGLFSDFNELIQEWSNTYLEGGSKANELSDLATVPERKAHFIAFMERKYGAGISDSIREKINTEANKFEEAGVFTNLQFGGNKKRYKRKTHKKKNTRKKFTKKYKKKIRN